MYLWVVLVIVAASFCQGAFLPKELLCPQGGFITRETFCEDTPGCLHKDDSDTIYPRGPCMSELQGHSACKHKCVKLLIIFLNRSAEVGNKSSDYRFSCGSKGEVVPLEAMCNGSVECTNGKDETNAFCPYNRPIRAAEDCNPRCLHGGVCHGGYCICPTPFTGEFCHFSERNLIYLARFIRFMIRLYELI